MMYKNGLKWTFRLSSPQKGFLYRTKKKQVECKKQVTPSNLVWFCILYLKRAAFFQTSYLIPMQENKMGGSFFSRNSVDDYCNPPQLKKKSIIHFLNCK